MLSALTDLICGLREEEICLRSKVSMSSVRRTTWRLIWSLIDLFMEWSFQRDTLMTRSVYILILVLVMFRPTLTSFLEPVAWLPVKQECPQMDREVVSTLKTPSSYNMMVKCKRFGIRQEGWGVPGMTSMKRQSPSKCFPLRCKMQSRPIS